MNGWAFHLKTVLLLTAMAGCFSAFARHFGAWEAILFGIVAVVGLFFWYLAFRQVPGPTIYATIFGFLTMPLLAALAVSVLDSREHARRTQSVERMKDRVFDAREENSLPDRAAQGKR